MNTISIATPLPPGDPSGKILIALSVIVAIVGGVLLAKWMAKNVFLAAALFGPPVVGAIAISAHMGFNFWKTLGLSCAAWWLFWWLALRSNK